METKRKCPIDERERFLKLYDVIVDLYRAYMANFVWTAGLICLSIGWFVSSEHARAFVRRSDRAFHGMLLVVLMLTLLHTGASWMYYRRSKSRVAQMTAEYEDLHPLPFAEYEIRTSVFALNLAVSWALATGLIVFVIAAQSLPPDVP